jgi:RNA polymerase sigma factor (sigma-70 family)
MANAQLDGVVRHVRALRDTEALSEAPDAHLLRRFTAAGEEGAFAVLLRRHGPMVLGVARRVLGNACDAEDVFQAAFLVLAKKAGSIRKGDSVASWLYGVAHRLAVRARAQGVRRQARERRAADMREKADGASRQDVQADLDAALGELPESYRAALVLCYLEGKTHAEAARQQGCPLATLRTRVARGRKLLRDRLAARGLTLSAAGLMALLLANTAPAAVPASLIRATLKAALPFAAGKPAAALCSDRVADLVKGGLQTMFLTRTKVVTAGLLLAGLLAGAGALAQFGAHAAAGPKPRPSAPALPATKDGGEVACAGRVLGPDGEPAAGASVAWWPRTGDAPLARTVTDREGRYRLSPPGRTQPPGTVVATADGFGPDWAEAPPAGRDLILRLNRDDVPINGRILTLEGRPVAGATVRVLSLEKPEHGGLEGWIEGRKRNHPIATTSLRPARFGGTASVKTDDKGRFRLTGLGRERVVSLWVSGPGVSQAHFWVLTRTEGVEGLQKGYYGTYAATFDFLMKPSKPIVGTVRDRRTGEPLPGITVGSFRWVHLTTKTDEKGRYRIDGAPKDDQYTVSAGGMPYFNSTRLRVPDTEGLTPLTVDFDLDRGVVVRGRLLERGTGKPVRGFVGFVPAPDNPHRKDFADIGQPQVSHTRQGEAGADGSFEVLAIPGPGALTATASDEGRYLRSPPGKIDLGRLIVEQYHAVVPIDVSEKAKTTYDITLEPARTLAGTVAGPDGKPLAGACAVGLSDVFGLWLGSPIPMPTASFTVGGLAPGRTRSLVLIHPEMKLARVWGVRGDEKGPLTVRLEPLAGLAGRVVGADGKPWADLKVQVVMSADRKDYDDLPVDLLYNYPQWQKLTGASATKDKEGRFRVTGLVPGLKYLLQVSEGDPAAGVFVYSAAVPALTAGATKDLGRLKARPRSK